MATPARSRHGTAAPDALARLTTREADVLRLAAEGRTNLQVAAELGVTVHCVKFHLASVFRKLNVKNRTEAAVMFLTRPDAASGGG